MRKIIIAGFALLLFGVKGFSQSAIEDTLVPLKFFICEQVVNANDPNEKQIIQLWKDYLSEGEFGDSTSSFWSFEDSNNPDEYLWAIGVESLDNRDYQVQCKIIGVYPVQHDYYCLKSAFTHIDDQGEIHLDVIPTVYAKKFNGEFLLVNSATYHKEIHEHRKVGNINYYVHPAHKFDYEKAKRMSDFNNQMAVKFSSDTIECTYFVANSSREIVEIWGYEYMDRMYRPEQTGGVAIPSDNILYCGNNSEYYPHELIHLYAYNVSNNFPHFWLNEGIATYFGGSTEKSFEWHLNELKEFCKLNPSFDYSDIAGIGDTYIPNGKHLTEFRYILGAIIIREVYENDGMDGIKAALNQGNTNEDFFHSLKKN
ncbi:MAG: hypothetical protein MK105_19400 [Crocinitomicaceae bacterium]|nr:hypothetical protein [Crocinitomicaceae bacterium]